MKVYIKDYQVRQDLIELISRIFYGEEIEILEDEIRPEDLDQEAYIYSRKLGEETREYIRTSLYINGELSRETQEDIKSVDVYMGGYKKKLQLALKKSLVTLGGPENKLPWGTLTGIRPMKIVHNLRDRNVSWEEIERVFKNEYLVDRSKINYLLDIARFQRPLIDKNKKKYSIYISIPFCPSKCSYCSFPTMVLASNRSKVEEYIDLLIYEIKTVLNSWGTENLNNIYIGGGTPSSIPMDQLFRLIDFLAEIIDLSSLEFTVEAGRPDTLNKAYLEGLYKRGVNRISINPQTMNDKTLELIGRSHSSQDVIDIYEIARDIGFKNINMDLILGLPGEGLEEIGQTLDRIDRLNPSNLTIHTLALKRGSEFSRFMKDTRPIAREEIAMISGRIDESLDRLGLKPYYLYRQKHSFGNLENIGYARAGYECIYNISMMEERETILGFGMGSVSKLYDGSQIERLPNFKGYEDYKYRIDEQISNKLKALVD